MLGEQITQRVVLFFQDKVRGVGHACEEELGSFKPKMGYQSLTRINLFFNLLFALAEQKELETDSKLA